MRARRSWPGWCLAGGLLGLGVGAVLLVANAGNHRLCGATLVAMTAGSGCAGVERRWVGGVLAIIVGLVLVITAVLGWVTNPARNDVPPDPAWPPLDPPGSFRARN